MEAVIGELLRQGIPCFAGSREIRAVQRLIPPDFLFLPTLVKSPSESQRLFAGNYPRCHVSGENGMNYTNDTFDLGDVRLLQVLKAIETDWLIYH
jgi:hypothetical protein